MFENWRYRRRLKTLQGMYRKTEERFRKAYAQAKTTEERNNLDYDQMHELGEIDHDIDVLQTNYLREQARRYDLPVPAFDRNGSDWEEGPHGIRWTLTVEARSKLRAAIRAEQKERTELWHRWIPVVTVLIGFGGMAVGVLSFLYR